MTEAPDPEVVELATKIFDLARRGRTEELVAYVDAGVPANLTNDRGDSLVMLAAYHGHAGAVRALLARGAEADRINDRGQTPLAGAVFKGRRTSSKRCWRPGRTPPPARRRPSTPPGCSARPTSWSGSASTERRARVAPSGRRPGAADRARTRYRTRQDDDHGGGRYGAAGNFGRGRENCRVIMTS